MSDTPPKITLTPTTLVYPFILKGWLHTSETSRVRLSAVDSYSVETFAHNLTLNVGDRQYLFYLHNPQAKGGEESKQHSENVLKMLDGYFFSLSEERAVRLTA